jgi:lipopolysaccharide transport system permease protein
VLKQRQTYRSDSQALQVRETARAMLSGLWQSRYMAYRLFLKDIRSEHARSAFGVLWDFLDPFVLGTIFFILAQNRVINTGNMGMPVAVFMIYGLLMYQTFCDSLIRSQDVVRRSGNLLSHLKVPPEALLASVLFRQLFFSVFSILVMLGFSLALIARAKAEGTSSFSLLGFLKFVLAYPSLILAGMAIGVFLAPFNAIYADVGRFARLVLIPLRYVSPVLYVLPATPLFDAIDRINPISPVLTNLRSLATADALVEPTQLLTRLGGFAVLFLVGWYVFHVSIPVLVERI